MPSELLREPWSGAEDALRRRLGDDVYAGWFSGLTVLSASDGEISLGVANAWVQEWIETRYLVSITQALRELSDQDLCVSFSVDPYLYGKHRAEQKAVFGDDTLGSDGTESRRPPADGRRADVWQGVVVPDFPPSADGEVEPTDAVRGAAGRQAASRAPGARPVQRSERGVQEVGAIRLPLSGGAGHRSGRQTTKYSVVAIPFAATLLTRGRNTVALWHANSDPYTEGDEKGESGPGPGYLMYDAIRLESE